MKFPLGTRRFQRAVSAKDVLIGIRRIGTGSGAYLRDSRGVNLSSCDALKE